MTSFFETTPAFQTLPGGVGVRFCVRGVYGRASLPPSPHPGDRSHLRRRGVLGRHVDRGGDDVEIRRSEERRQPAFELFGPPAARKEARS